MKDKLTFFVADFRRVLAGWPYGCNHAGFRVRLLLMLTVLLEPVSWCGSHMVVALDVDVLYQYIKCFVVPMDLEYVREERDIILI